jgi:hypothetical protein
MDPPPFLPGACTPCDPQLGGLSPLVAPSLSGSINENNNPHSEGCPLMDTPPFPPELEPPRDPQLWEVPPPRGTLAVRVHKLNIFPPFRRVATHGPTPFLPRILSLLYTPYMRGVYMLQASSRLQGY